MNIAALTDPKRELVVEREGDYDCSHDLHHYDVQQWDEAGTQTVTECVYCPRRTVERVHPVTVDQLREAVDRLRDHVREVETARIDAEHERDLALAERDRALAALDEATHGEHPLFVQLGIRKVEVSEDAF